MLSVLTSLIPTRVPSLDRAHPAVLIGAGATGPGMNGLSTIDPCDVVGLPRATGKISWKTGWKNRLLAFAAQSLRPGGSGGGSAEAAEQLHDPEELHKLVVEYGDAVFRVAQSVVKDRALAEDVAQETMVKAWMALPTFRGDSSLRGWILRIAHNTAISTLRQRRAVVLDPFDMPESVDLRERSVETNVQSNLVLDDFAEALDLLDELSRSIVVLRELEGLSYEEIAEVLEVPLPTVKTRLLRARRKLSAALREWER